MSSQSVKTPTAGTASSLRSTPSAKTCPMQDEKVIRRCRELLSPPGVDIDGPISPVRTLINHFDEKFLGFIIGQRQSSFQKNITTRRVRPTPVGKPQTAVPITNIETLVPEQLKSPTKPVADSPTKPVADSPTKSVADSPTKSVADSPTKSVADSPTKSVADSPTKSVADSPTKPVADSPTKPVADSPTKPVADSPTKPVADSPTKPPESPKKAIEETIHETPDKS